MTVAAVILSASAEGALTDTLGQPRVRRLVDIAWAGGALPVVVLAPDQDGAVARAIAETEATWFGPAPAEYGPVGQMVRGIELAAAEVRDTSAALLWPARMIWVGAETVTSLIEAHGVDPDTILRPSWQGESGWPALVPLTRLADLRGLDATFGPDEALAALTTSVPSRSVELGDPGVVFDAGTPETDLPPYEGPGVPAGGHVHEWGETLGEIGDTADVPGEGRGLAPYPQAAPGGPGDV
jgi:CTP:molybdopterin cytidylyltransferase MocA